MAHPEPIGPPAIERQAGGQHLVAKGRQIRRAGFQQQATRHAVWQRVIDDQLAQRSCDGCRAVYAQGIRLQIGAGDKGKDVNAPGRAAKHSRRATAAHGGRHIFAGRWHKAGDIGLFINRPALPGDACHQLAARAVVPEVPVCKASRRAGLSGQEHRAEQLDPGCRRADFKCCGIAGAVTGNFQREVVVAQCADFSPAREIGLKQDRGGLGGAGLVEFHLMARTGMVEERGG